MGEPMAVAPAGGTRPRSGYADCELTTRTIRTGRKLPHDQQTRQCETAADATTAHVPSDTTDSSEFRDRFELARSRRPDCQMDRCGTWLLSTGSSPASFRAPGMLSNR